jgi:hypothetical protein
MITEMTREERDFLLAALDNPAAALDALTAEDRKPVNRRAALKALFGEK